MKYKGGHSEEFFHNITIGSRWSVMMSKINKCNNIFSALSSALEGFKYDKA